MRKFAFTLFIIIGVTAFAQEADTLSAFSDAEQEAEYQSFYAADDEEDEEVMSRTIVQGGSTGRVNTRPVDTSNQAPCKMWAILVADTHDESIGEDDAYDNLALNKEIGNHHSRRHQRNQAVEHQRKNPSHKPSLPPRLEGCRV